MAADQYHLRAQRRNEKKAVLLSFHLTNNIFRIRSVEKGKQLKLTLIYINTVLAYPLVACFKVTKDPQHTSFLPQIKTRYCTVPCIHKSFHGKVPHLTLKYPHQEAQAMNHRSDLCAIS